ncbi:MAG: stage II sporulation protein M [Deltaproteobacteria bacterium]|nr:stage II sporulation protein M [Deltaproteobacteria bacterium]
MSFRRATTIFLLDIAQGDKPPGPWRLLLESVVAATFGIACGRLLFPGEASLVGVFLVAIGQTRTAERLLDRNRVEVWGGGAPARDANARLATALLVMFLGVLGTYVAFALLLPIGTVETMFGRQVGDFGGRSITEVDFGNLPRILGHNLAVAGVAFLFSLVYRHAGMLLMLAWNASVWGVVFPFTARTAPDVSAAGSVVYFAKAFVAIFPHLLLEAVSYVLVALAGVFLSKAIRKHKPGTPAFRQVGLASARIGGAGLAMLAVACVLEAQLAPALISALF